ncbi:hypothetical protein FNV43_RR07636 [Rhamnella rubrinervis]|uniref:Bromo domain-containing protein n=1 Tax=Rhamnella rubrinervis TaxID=2594499 RepID=A0A8K0HFN0_9ROSA|nr:hypothetical protein FNV43_RR07636 [Rhamnella rubrinervis]
MKTEVIGRRWGTWEELLLGGAVLRHGNHDWNVVAAELGARTLCPFIFTPSVCKSKYEDLQQRYSGSKTLFEELRKKRMAELRQALEVSEDSIGSLETKLETLKADEGDHGQINCGSNQTESPLPFQKSKGFESSSKETSKDGLSAGSFTLETRTSWSSECQIPAAVLAEEIQTKLEALHSFEQDKVSIIEKLAENAYGRQGGTVKKRRGKRKRKDCSRDAKEGSVGESGLLDSTDAVTVSQCKENSADAVAVSWTKENSTTDCCEVSRSSGSNDQTGGSVKEGIDDLMRVFSSILEHKSASSFRRRLDSQKRGRYKKMIRRHMDFDTLRSRITSRSIMSVKEVFRDVLLLANNALVFYSKNTREHKSALLLRDFTTKTLRQHFDHDYISKAASASLPPKTTMYNPPVKPRSIRHGNKKSPGKAAISENTITKMTSNAGKKTRDAYATPVESLGARKKGFGRPRKVGGKIKNQPSQTPANGRKRVRTR